MKRYGWLTAALASVLLTGWALRGGGGCPSSAPPVHEGRSVEAAAAWHYHQCPSWQRSALHCFVAGPR
jgi:hypothetical protein